jgi:hypothetical protein
VRKIDMGKRERDKGAREREARGGAGEIEQGGG